jgi:hypothetical protein
MDFDLTEDEAAVADLAQILADRDIRPQAQTAQAFLSPYEEEQTSIGAVLKLSKMPPRGKRIAIGVLTRPHVTSIVVPCGEVADDVPA